MPMSSSTVYSGASKSEITVMPGFAFVSYRRVRYSPAERRDDSFQ